MNKIKVHIEKGSSSSYEIHIGYQIMDRMALILANQGWAHRYFLLTDSRVSALHGERVLAILRGMGLTVEEIVFPGGEEQKSIHTCTELAERMMERGADRTSALIALGGGVVGDLTAFLASIYMRGIPHIQVPTTILAQVDSSIGGKTGVDLPSAKNLLGTFTQPKAVFIDLAFLETLSPREFINGLAEIVKYGIIEDPEILEELREGEEALRRRDPAFLAGIIAKACRIKKAIVESDETDKGLRRILNFGHTVGHAIEAESGFAVSHGEAVAMGMCAAALLSERRQYLSPEDREKIFAAIGQAGLPVRIPSSLDPEGILRGLKRDKKKEGDQIRFILLKRPGQPFVNGGIPLSLVRETIEELRA
jgi:3-dehydroquinate synthase